MDVNEIIEWLRGPEAESFLRDAIVDLDYAWDGQEETPIEVHDFQAGARALADMIEKKNESVAPVDDEPRNPYRTLHARMSPPGAAWDEGFAAGRAAERDRILALLGSDEVADVNQRALFVSMEAIFDDDDMPAAGDYYRISRAALAAIRSFIDGGADV